MALKEDLDCLYQLQRCDSELARAAQELTTLDNGSQAAQQAREAQQDFEKAVQRLQETEGSLTDKELELEGTESEQAEKWQRAYGGTISDPKELSALERKIQELDRHKNALEEEILGRYDEIEQLRAQRDQAEEYAQEAATRAKRLRLQYQERTRQLEQATENLRRQREEFVPPLPASLYEQYEKMRERNNGIAVAALESGACGFCHTKAPSEYTHELRNPTRLVRCESCGRILVLVEE